MLVPISVFLLFISLLGFGLGFSRQSTCALVIGALLLFLELYLHRRRILR